MDAFSKPPFAERRSEKRKIVDNCLVKLDPGTGRPPFTCFVWDMSESGVRLKLSEIIDLPPSVHIIIGNVRKAAKVVWQKADQAGFKFFEMPAATK
jgi:hypothetical protein